MSPLPRPHSIRARYTLIATLSALSVLVLLGVTLDVAIRSRVQFDAFRQAERVASRWSAAARRGHVPRTIPVHGPVELVQIVDAHQRVLVSSRPASAVVPLSRYVPPPDARFQRRIECPEPGRCLLLQALRVSPAPQADVVYAGMPQPDLLATHDLEYVIAVGVCVIAGIVAWTVWELVGRTLRPVEQIRARISQIAVGDLSLRVPVPPGFDEVAQLAVTANQTLTQLESAVEQQRRFACTTSHELRTPIAALRTQLEEALLYPDDTDVRRTFEAALATAGRLEAIVNDLLLLARLRADDRQPSETIDIGELAAAEVGAQPGSVPTSVRACPGLEIRGSRMQLIRVLDNLLANAWRHAASAVEVTVEPAGYGVAVTVADDGSGIPPAYRERVFERFVRLDDSRRLDPGGSGLGLAISRDIAHTHHGTLRVDDSPHGAKFVLWLPLLRRSSDEVVPSHGSPSPAVPGSRRPARGIYLRIRRRLAGR